MVITDSSHYLPLLDADGNIQVIWTRDIFPVFCVFMPWIETEGGPIELLIGLDNTQWLPIHVEDPWDPDNDMRLMKSSFGHEI
jgi:hypothetical protein